MNSVQLIGRAVRDCELRNGGAIAVLTLAVNVGKEETSFFPVVMLNKTAEICSKYVHKGSLIGITGRLKQRSFVREDGSKGSIIEVICDNLDLLEKKPTEQPVEEAKSKSKTSKTKKAKTKSKEDKKESLEGIETTDDDLPF